MEIGELSTDEYIAFSDQDDVWQRDKRFSQLNAMQQLERQFPGSPLLPHWDMEVIDEELECILPLLLCIITALTTKAEMRQRFY